MPQASGRNQRSEDPVRSLRAGRRADRARPVSQGSRSRTADFEGVDNREKRSVGLPSQASRGFRPPIKLVARPLPGSPGTSSVQAGRSSFSPKKKPPFRGGLFQRVPCGQQGCRHLLPRTRQRQERPGRFYTSNAMVQIVDLSRLPAAPQGSISCRSMWRSPGYVHHLDVTRCVGSAASPGREGIK